MTKKEKEVVKWAIDELLKDDGNFVGAIGKLCRLTGQKYLAYELLKDKGIKAVSLGDLAKGGNRIFEVKTGV